MPFAAAPGTWRDAADQACRRGRARPGRADFTASTAAAEASGLRQARPDIGLLQQVLRGRSG